MQERLPITAADAPADIRHLYTAPPELPALLIPEAKPATEWELAPVPAWLEPGPDKAWRPHFMVDGDGLLRPRVREGFSCVPLRLDPVECMLMNALMVAGPSGIIERDFIKIADFARRQAGTRRQGVGKKDIEMFYKTISSCMGHVIETRRSPMFKTVEKFRHWGFNPLANFLDTRRPEQIATVSPLIKPVQRVVAPKTSEKPEVSDKPSLTAGDTQKLGKLTMFPVANTPIAKETVEAPPEPSEPFDFDAFAKEYFPRIVDLARKRLSPSEWMTPEDIAQEVLQRAWTNVDRLDTTRRLTGWVLRVANNVIIDGVRHRQSRVQETRGQLYDDQALSTLVSPEAAEVALREDITGLDNDLLRFLEQTIQSGNGSTPSDELLHMFMHVKMAGCGLSQYVELHTKEFGSRYGNKPLSTGTIKSRVHYVTQKLAAQGDTITSYLGRDGGALKVDETIMVFKRLQALAVIEVDSKEQVTAEDDQKQPLTAYNYVEYRLYNKNLTRYLDLASPQELLAARVLQGLRGTPAIRTKEGRLLHAESLKNHVWNSMPIAERQLFIKPGGKEDDVYGGPQPILDDLVRIVNQLGRAEGARPAMILPGGTQGALLHPRGLTLGSTFFKEPRQQEPQQSLLFPKRNPNV